ncbi:MAG: acyl-CoA dehydratase activase [Spirochaetota bacterium]|jgi:predicted CoA-substrate-specific enzyme activase|nr:acyl-CoA dehydratase activase [Spirochaetota bacterium]
MFGIQETILGIDIGSAAIKAVLVGAEGVIGSVYRRLDRAILDAFRGIIAWCAEAFPGRAEYFALTGRGAEGLAEARGWPLINEIFAQASGALALVPGARSVIDIGGNDAAYIALSNDATSARPGLAGFAANSRCAAGTGSFLEQQAARLGLDIEEGFSALALTAKHIPHIAGRCSVFAKSDMIHLQQIATPESEIVAGLCQAMAESFRSDIMKGSSPLLPISFQGGVSRNAAMVASMRRAFSLEERDLIVHPDAHLAGALGAALRAGMDGTRSARGMRIPMAEAEEFGGSGLAANRDKSDKVIIENTDGQEDGSGLAGRCGGMRLASAKCGKLDKVIIENTVGQDGGDCGANEKIVKEILHADKTTTSPRLAPLALPDSAYLEVPSAPPLTALGELREVFLGIDIGSVSTNLALIDHDGNLVAKRYLATAGRPIEAVLSGLRGIYAECGKSLRVLGCGTTGSGRYLIADLFGADIVKNEITAQARGALLLCPDADTIFEIGGQDSKYIAIDHGVVTDFTMNKACAAGTGSFIEEQANLMGISVRDEFAARAFAADVPASLGQRCTVFIENDVKTRLAEGDSIENLSAGIAYSVVHNYLHRVVENRRVGRKVLFQGGTASNRAVTAAFRAITGKEVSVPPHNDVTGAIGMAVIAAELYQKKPFATSFIGLSAGDLAYSVNTFICRSCANTCEIREVRRQGGKPFYYGHRCERYDQKKSQAADSESLDFTRIRKKLLEENIQRITRGVSVAQQEREQIGIPLALAFYETLPFWTAFWTSLGYRVVHSGETTRGIAEAGITLSTAETCHPVKVFHGHTEALLKMGVQRIFVPSVINMPLEGSQSEHNFSCTLIQSAPFLLRAAFRDREIDILSPVIHMQYGRRHVLRELGSMAKELGISTRRLDAALGAAYSAQQVWRADLEQAALDFLARYNGRPIAVIASRPYNGCDSGLNLNVPRRLAESGIPVLHLESLPISLFGGKAVGKNDVYSENSTGKFYDAKQESAAHPAAPHTSADVADSCAEDGDYTENSIGKFSAVPQVQHPTAPQAHPAPPAAQISAPAPWAKMYWRYGQRIMRGLDWAARTPGILPVYISNFSCGPDSFLLHYAQETMGSRPLLVLELDEHSADAGVITRLEAWLDSALPRSAPRRQDVGLPQYGANPSHTEKDSAEYAGSAPAADQERANRARRDTTLRGKKVFVPKMSDNSMPIAAAFRRAGIDAAVLPPVDAANVETGRKITSGRECYPLVLTAADIFKIPEMPGYAPGRAVFFMPTTNGPCRFGEYARLQSLILEREELSGIEIFSPSSGSGYGELRELSLGFYLDIWKGMVCVDVLAKALHAARPYEKTPGASDALYAECIERLERALESEKRDLPQLMREFQKRFQAIPRRAADGVPIGVVGEIYVRLNTFANGDIIRRLERLGAEVVSAPFTEWSFYANRLSMQNNIDQKHYLAAMSDYFRNKLQYVMEERLAKPFHAEKFFMEPEIDAVLEAAGQFIDRRIRGEAVLTVGKAVDFIARGFGGIVNLMPFSCMPGLIVSSLAPAVAKHYADLPWLNIAFEDSAAVIDAMRLEAFVEQARAYAKRREEKDAG